MPWSVGQCVRSPCCVRCPRWLRQGFAAGTILSGCSSSRPRFPLARDDAKGRATTARCPLQPVRRTFWSMFRICGHIGEDRPGWGVAWTGIFIQRNAWLRRCYDPNAVMSTRTRWQRSFSLYYILVHCTLHLRV